MRRARLAAVLALAMLAGSSGAARGAPGDLDPSFHDDGKLTIDFGGSNTARDVLVQPDGKLVLAGDGNASPNFAIARILSDGLPDSSFASLSVDFGGPDYVNGAALQPDGKIVVAGFGETGTTADVAVARVNPSGGFDAGFNPGGAEGVGKLLIDYGAYDSAAEVLLQPDGKLVLASTGGNPGPDMLVSRLLTDGTPDFSFAYTPIDFGGMDYASAAALQPDGKIVVAGGASTVVYDAAIARVNPTGGLDGGFDGDGKKTIDWGGPERTSAVLVQPDGKIVVAGYGGGGNINFIVSRLNPDGSPDPSFDGDGTAEVDFGGSDRAFALALQANGKLVLAGSTSAGNDMAVARLQPGGSLDLTFSLDGKRAIDFGVADTAYDVALQPDGKIVVAGSTSGGAAVARLEGEPPGSGGPGGGGGGGTGGKPPRCEGKRATIVGTARRDVLRGTRRADVIAALGGNDVVKGNGGNDRICGGRGNDRLSGGGGGDRLLGEAGRDRLLGEAGRDRLVGGPQSDLLSGGPDPDRLLGGSDRDRLLGGPGRDALSGGPGRDSQKQ